MGSPGEKEKKMSCCLRAIVVNYESTEIGAKTVMT